MRPPRYLTSRQLCAVFPAVIKFNVTTFNVVTRAGLEPATFCNYSCSTLQPLLTLSYLVKKEG